VPRTVGSARPVPATGEAAMEPMSEGMRTPLPVGIEPLERWTHAGVECAVGSVGHSIYGLARVRSLLSGWTSIQVDARGHPVLSPENLGEWTAFAVPDISHYWSNEVVSRFVNAASADLVAWDVCGHTWAIQRIQREVNELVDDCLRSRPQPTHRNNGVGKYPV
jgi:hypothetical protein